MATVTAKDVLDELKEHIKEDRAFHTSINRTAWRIVGAIGSAMLLIGTGIVVQAWTISHAVAQNTHEAAAQVSTQVSAEHQASLARDARIEALLTKIAAQTK